MKKFFTSVALAFAAIAFNVSAVEPSNPVEGNPNEDASIAAYYADLEALNEFGAALTELQGQLDEFAEGLDDEALEYINEQMVTLNAKLVELSEAIEDAGMESDATGEYAEVMTAEVQAELYEQLSALANYAESTYNYAMDQAMVQELITSWASMIETIEEEAPFGVDEAYQAQVYAQIVALQDMINAALELARETGFYVAQFAGEEPANAEAYAAAVKAAQDYFDFAVATNDYNQDIASIKELTDAYSEMLEAVSDFGDDVRNAETEGAIYAKITALNDKAQAALEAAYEAEKLYESPLTAEEVMAIAAEIQQYNDFCVSMAAIEADQEALNSLTTSWEEVMAQVAEDCPDAVNAEEETAITAAIEALNELFIKAQEQAENIGFYVAQFTGEEPVSAEAYAEVAERAANYYNYCISAQARENDETNFKVITDLWEECLAAIDADYAEYASEEVSAPIYAKIEALNTAMNNALEFYGEEGVYAAQISEETVQELAAEIRAYFDYVASMAAYEADVEMVNELVNSWAEVIATVAEDYPLAVDAEEETAITKAIEDLNSMLEAALMQTEETGFYVAQFAGEEPVAAEAYTEVAARAAAYFNNAASKQALEEDYENLKVLTDMWQECIDTIGANYPDYADETVAAPIYAKIEALQNAINDALEFYGNEGVYAAQVSDETVQEIAAEIRAYFDFAVSMAAYDADVEKVNDLANSWAEVIELVAAEYPLAVDAEEETAITQAIEALNNQVVAALELTGETGFYVAQFTGEEPVAAEAYAEVAARAAAYFNNAASKQALEEDYENLKVLTDMWQECIDMIAAEYPLGADEFVSGPIYAKIEALNNAINDALEFYGEEGVYAAQVSDETVQEMAAEIRGYLDYAISQQAIQEDYQLVKDLTDAYTEAVTEVETLYADAQDKETEATIYAEIIAINDAIEAAIEAAATEGYIYTGVDFAAEYDQIQKEIRDYLWTCSSVHYMTEDEATINELLQAYQEMVDTVGALYEDARDEETEAAINAEIMALYAAHQAALEAAGDTNYYESVLTEGSVVLAIGEEMRAYLNECAAIHYRNEDQEAINELWTAYDELINLTTTDYVEVADEATEAAIRDRIQALQDAFDAAVLFYGENGHYEPVTSGVDCKEIGEMMRQYLADLEGMSEFPAFTVDRETIATLYATYDQMLEYCADFELGKDAEMEAEVKAEIDALNEAIYAALEAAKAEEDGEYVSPATEEVVWGIQQNIFMYITFCEGMHYYNEDIEALQPVGEMLQALNDLADGVDADYRDTELEASFNAAYMAMNANVEAALEVFGEEYTYEPAVNAAEVIDLCNNIRAYYMMLESAIAMDEDEAQLQEIYVAFEEARTLAAENDLTDEDVEAEIIAAYYALYNKTVEAREDMGGSGYYNSPITAEEYMALCDAVRAYNNNVESAIAYNEDVAQINELSNAYQELVDTVDAEFPEGKNYMTEKELYAAIEAMNDQVEAALKAYGENGYYVSPIAAADYVELAQAMAQYLKDAESGQLMANDEETLNGLVESYIDLQVEIEETRPELLEDEALTAIMNDIMALAGDCRAAAEDAYEKGIIYQSPLTESAVAEIAKRIAAYRENNLTGIESILNDVDGAVYFDLSGNRILKPAAGNVYIKVEGGKTSKVLVK